MIPTPEWTTGKTIRISSSPSLTGPYSDPSPPVSPNFREAVTKRLAALKVGGQEHWQMRLASDKSLHRVLNPRLTEWCWVIEAAQTEVQQAGLRPRNQKPKPGGAGAGADAPL